LPIVINSSSGLNLKTGGPWSLRSIPAPRVLERASAGRARSPAAAPRLPARRTRRVVLTIGHLDIPVAIDDPVREDQQALAKRFDEIAVSVEFQDRRDVLN
jgi:hypothetical protein